MSKLSETLQELLNEQNSDCKTLAENIGISASRITDYIKHDKLPTVENLIKLADYFNCSTDYLLGREYEQTHEKYKTPAPFSERLQFLKKLYGYTHKEIYSAEGISNSRYFEWLNGKRQPSVDSVIALADFFGCSVDFVLGREN